MLKNEFCTIFYKNILKINIVSSNKKNVYNYMYNNILLF